MQEILFVVDWNLWATVIASIIAGISLVLSIRQIRRKRKRDCVNDLENTIDKSTHAIEKLEEEVRAIGREKDDLRRDKFELLQQIANLTKKKNGDGGSEK